MKKLFIGIVFVLVFVSALSVSAQYDLSGFSYTDLLTIVAQAQREMMTRSEFQEVTVPAGLYQVGVEIPAGKWTISLPTSDDKYASADIDIGDKLDAGKNDIALWDSTTYDSIYLSKSNNKTTYTVTLIDGYYIKIGHSVVFSTPTGATFSFK